MEKEQAKKIIRERIPCASFLEESKNGLFCCPFCGSGKNEKKTGALKVYDTNTFCCHSCGETGDVIDLYRAKTGASYHTALQSLAQSAKVSIDEESTTHGHQEGEQMQKQENEAADFREYFRDCRKRIDDPKALAYLKERGISAETAKAYRLGYDPAWRSHKALREGKDPQPTPRLIIPTSRAHYIARDIRENIPEQFQKFSKMNEGTPQIFNCKALYENEAVFVTEGAFDALSFIELGYPAIATNSAGNIKKLLLRLKEKPCDATLILCLDADGAGQRATQELKEGLKRLGVPFVVADVCCGCKDPNEALVQDRAAFRAAIEGTKTPATRPHNTSLYIDRLMAQDIAHFGSGIKTGFANLDDLTGGLHSGLYILAAISSLGKTTFALQLADQLAAQGQDVIFYSLEQSTLELVSKSLARRTVQASSKPVYSLLIRKGYEPIEVVNAKRAYKAEVGDRLSIIEGNFSCTTTDIGDYVRQYMKRTNTRPIVFVDYLQVVQPSSHGHQSTKEAVDMTVTQLKRLSRELNITLFVISSVNRSSYLNPIAFESLKESGSLEYTADVVFGLDLACLAEIDARADIAEKRQLISEEKAKIPRKLNLVCLKNRYGISSFSCQFSYYPQSDLFVEIAAEKKEKKQRK